MLKDKPVGSGLQKAGYVQLSRGWMTAIAITVILYLHEGSLILDLSVANVPDGIENI